MPHAIKTVLYFLGTLNDQDVEWLMAHGRKLTVEAGAEIIVENRPTEHVFFILSGEFTVNVSAAAEQPRIAPGEMLGEISFVDSRPPSATVTALVESTVGAVPVAALSAKLESDTAFAARFYKSMSIALADRLRARLPGSRGAELEDDAQLSGNVLDIISMAGSRFAEMQRRTWGS